MRGEGEGEGLMLQVSYRPIRPGRSRSHHRHCRHCLSLELGFARLVASVGALQEDLIAHWTARPRRGLQLQGPRPVARGQEHLP